MPNRNACATLAWLDRAMYPFQPRFHETAHGRMHYVDAGSGPAVLFVHGTPSWSFEWRHAILSLRDRYRCIAPDHLGFGLSDKPAAAPYQPADHAARLCQLVSELDLRDLTLVLHDFGGPIGLPLVLREPGRVRQIVLSNTWMWPLGAHPGARWLSRLVSSPLGRLSYLWFNASPRWLLPMSFGDRSRLTPRALTHYLAPFASREARQAPWVLGRELTGSDPYYASLWAVRGVLERIPMAFIWGMSDRAFGASFLSHWQATFAHAQTFELPGVGHFPQEEMPSAFSEILAAIVGGRPRSDVEP